MNDSQNMYDRPDNVREWVNDSRHRKSVGGLWEEMGNLQLEFLITRGLKPHHTLLDIGCGSLRGGTKLIPYLDPGNYWGIDKNSSLIDAGWEFELAPTGLQQRQPRNQLIVLDDFEFSELGVSFDFALAQSVFSHFPLNRIRRCLSRLAPVMKPRGQFYATFFEVPGYAEPESAIVQTPGGITTHSDRDPYHYRLQDLQYCIDHLPWQLTYVGAWNHPRNQKMMLFSRI